MSLSWSVIQLLLVWLPALFMAVRLLPLQGGGRIAFCVGASGILALVFSGAVVWLGLVATGQLQAWLPAVLLISAATLTALFSGRASASDLSLRSASAVSTPSGRAERVAILILAALIAVRVISLLPDVLLRPLFAWDAWTVWGYEARVWLEQGRFVEFAAPGEWLTAPAGQFIRDTLVAYPKLLPALMLWTVPAGSEWTGVGPGILWLAIAVFTSMVIYGTVRLTGARSVWALGAAYIFLSLPMVNAHVALYGYADLWMASLMAVFAGLLVLAERAERKLWLVLGTVVLAMLPLVKLEGTYWVVCGLAAWLATRLRLSVRVLVLLGAGATIGVLMAGAFGLDLLALVTAGRLEIGSADIFDALAGASRHAFVWFDWHLLIYLVLAAVILLVLRPVLVDRVRALTAFCLFGLFMLGGFTPLTGAAEFLSIGTLFSRIFLQFSPPLIILGVLILQRLAADAKDHAADVSGILVGRVFAAMALSALLLWIGWSAWALSDGGLRQTLPPYVIEPERAGWRMVEGSGELTAQGLQVTAAGRRGRTLLAIELPADLRTDHYDRAELKFRDAVPEGLALGWSRVEIFQPGNWVSMEPDQSRLASADLGGDHRWQEPVYFLAIEQIGFADGPWVLETVILHRSRPTFLGLQAYLLEGLHAKGPWKPRDLNLVWPDDRDQLFSATFAVALWILLTGLLLGPIRPRNQAWTIAWLGLPIAVGWLALDLRWQVELGHKAHATVSAFAGQSPAERFASDIDGGLFEFLQNLRDSYPRSDFERIFAFSDSDFLRKRARYHLAGWSVREKSAHWLSPAAANQLVAGDLLLLLRTPELRLEPVDSGSDAELFELLNGKGEVLLRGERILHRSDWAALRVR